MLVHNCHFSCVQLFATLWTIAHQAALSVGVSRKECWSELDALLQGIFLTRDQSQVSYVSCILYLGRYFIIRYYKKKKNLTTQITTMV